VHVFYCGIDGGQIFVHHSTWPSVENDEPVSETMRAVIFFKIRCTIIVKYMTFLIFYEICRIDQRCLFYGAFAGQFDFLSVPLLTACCRPTDSAISRGFILSHCIEEFTFRTVLIHFDWSCQCLSTQRQCVVTCLRRKRLRMEEYDVELIAWQRLSPCARLKGIRGLEV
jgi:hypothetical protein